MRPSDWIPLQEIQAIVKHGIAVLAVAVTFWAVLWVVQHLFTGWLPAFLEEVDSVVILGLAFWFTYQMGVVLWKGRDRIGGGPHALLLA